MKSREKYIGKIAIFGLTVLTFVLFFNFLTQSPKFKINTTIISELNESTYPMEYTLKQNEQIVNPTPAYKLPWVRTYPNSEKYRLVVLKEWIHTVLKVYNHLFFATKRIAELRKWGSDLDWNVILDRYTYHIQMYEKSIRQDPFKDKKYEELYDTLRVHHRTLEDLIYTQSNDDKSSIKKIQMIDRLFNRLYSLVPTQYYVTTDITPNPLKDVLANKEFGIYNVSVSVNKQPTETEIEAYHTSLPKVSIDSTFNLSDFIYGQLLITQYKQIKWQQINTPSETYKYQYRANIQNPNLPPNYIIKITYNLQKSVLFNLEKSKINKIYSRLLIPHGYSFTYLDSIKIEEYNEQNIDYYFILGSNTELNFEELNSISVDFIANTPIEITAFKTAPIPGTNPYVKIEKKSKFTYKITTINTTQLQDEIVLNSIGFGWKVQDSLQKNNETEFTVTYWFFNILKMLIYFLIFALITTILYTKERFQTLVRVVGLFFKMIISNPIQYLWKNIRNFCTKFRLILLLIVFFGIAYDSLIVKKVDDNIILLLAFAWIGVLAGYSLETRVNFVLALIFLTFTPLLLILKLESIAEKSAIWAYMFLVVGAIQTILEIKTNIKGVRIKNFIIKLFL